MASRIAVIGIIVEEPDSVKELNQILHEYGEYIIGRMGIPYRQRGVNIISVAMDAPQDMINAMTGKIGRLAGDFCKNSLLKKGRKHITRGGLHSVSRFKNVREYPKYAKYFKGRIRLDFTDTRFLSDTGTS